MRPDVEMYRFSCGCEFPILERRPGKMPLLDFDADENLRLDCPATWGLVGSGLTTGIFQLEKHAGKRWSKELKPENMEHIGALAAIIRPGCTNSIDKSEGVPLTQCYCDRKNGIREVKPYHPVIDSILFPTYNTLCYQEQAIMIAVAVAGLTPMEANTLRKSIGKKDASLMSQCRKTFLDGVKKLGVISDEQAAEVFSWIESSQRYSFNKSHAISYGAIGYDSAYIKAHFPLAFYAGWLRNEKTKADMAVLIEDAKLFDVDIRPPDLRRKRGDVHTDGEKVHLGLTSIAGVGESMSAKIFHAVAEAEAKLGKSVADWTWLDLLYSCLTEIGPGPSSLLISAGACSWTGMDRKVMLQQLSAWDSLTEKEQSWALEHRSEHESLDTLIEASAKKKKDGGACANEKRVSILSGVVHNLRSPPTVVKDTPFWIANTEQALLGVSITCSRVDSCDLSDVNMTCRDALRGVPREGFMVLGVEITEVQELVTKRGKNPGRKMCKLVVKDATASIEVIVFPDTYEEHSESFVQGNLVMIDAEFTKDNSLSVKRVWSLK